MTQTTKVALSATARQMLKARFEEHARLATEIKEKEARQKRIRTEVEELFGKEGQDEALENGTELDGHKVKRVRGHSSSLDKKGLMNALGLTPDELDAWFERKEKRPYIKISKAGEGDDEE